MEDLALILFLVGIVGIVYFWKKNKKNRNIAAVIVFFSLIAFGMSTEVAEERPNDTSSGDAVQEQTNNNGIDDTIADDGVVENTEFSNVSYHIVGEEFTALGSFNRLEYRVTTADQPDKNQIEQILKEIESEVLADYSEFDSEQDQLYIFLYENELISDSMYSLGRLIRIGPETEIDANQKDWDQQPNDEEYKLYVRFMERAMEMEEEAMEEDEFAVVEDDEVIELMATDKGIEEETISDSLRKVTSFIFMDQE